MTQIAVVGSANLDATVRLPRLPAPGETVLGGATAESVGGKGANQAVAAARLGRSVGLVGLVGDDRAGERIRGALAGEGVRTEWLGTARDAPSGRAFVLVDGDGENMITVSPGANAQLSAQSVRAAGDLLAEARAVVCQMEIPEEAVAQAVALAAGIVVLNPSPAVPVAAGVLERVDVLLVNRSELGVMAGRPEPRSRGEACEMAAGLTGPRSVVVTLGSDGAVLASGGEQTHVPAVPVETAVDPTGAGDTFCGALTDALVRGEDLDAAVRWAVRAAAFAVTAPGAQSAMPTAEQLGRA